MLSDGTRLNLGFPVSQDTVQLGAVRWNLRRYAPPARVATRRLTPLCPLGELNEKKAKKTAIPSRGDCQEGMVKESLFAFTSAIIVPRRMLSVSD